MPTRQLDLANSENWREIYNELHIAERIGGSRHYPLPEIPIPILLESHVICVFCESPSAPAKWRYAGLLRQAFQVGVAGGSIPQAQLQYENRLWLNRFNLAMFPEIDRSYSVSIHPPYWLDDIQVIVYEYIGIDTWSDDIRLIQANEKLDSLTLEQDPGDTVLIPAWASGWDVTLSGLEKSGKFAEVRGIVNKSNPTPNEIIGQLPEGVYPVREEVYQALDGDDFATFAIDTLGRIRFVNGSLPMPINKIYRINT